MTSARIVHVITGLPTGGAQMMLYKLLSRMDRSELEPEVVSLLDRGEIGEQIERLGIRVRALGLPSGPGAVWGIARLARWLREEPVDVVQCWMYHADLIGGLAARLAGNRRVIWGIRQGAPDSRVMKRSTLLTAKACARLSRSVPLRILCCSEASRRSHVALGYDASKMVVIPNGFDLDSFRPEPSRHAEVRNEFGIPESSLLVGLVARWDPQKDHRTFLTAAARVAERFAEVHFLLCGAGVDPGNAVLSRLVSDLALNGRAHLLGLQHDVARLLAALDVACLSSLAIEGFPNAVGEAMACGVPCVVTDIGDSAELVGDTGRVVPPQSPDTLADALSDLLAAGTAERRRLGDAARRRVEERYSLPVIVDRYRSLYHEVLSTSGFLKR